MRVFTAAIGVLITTAALAAQVSVTVTCQDPVVAIAPSDGGADAGAPDSGVDAGAPGAGISSSDAGSLRTATLWTWYDTSTTLARLPGQPFTHVSPALYQINYTYDGGVPQFSATPGGADIFGSSPTYTSAQYCAAVHDAGMRCLPLIFGGSTNGGTDQGIQNILNDSPAGTQASFINSLVSEGSAKHYDGWNLDWEVGSSTDYPTYGLKLQNFLAALKYALNAHGMQLSFDVGAWYVKQSWCSGGTGVVDLTTIGSVVDQAIIEDYRSALGTEPDGGAPTGCPSHINNPLACDTGFTSQLNLMCTYLTPDKYSIGLEAASSGTDPIAPQVIQALEAYGVQNVALWPDGAEANLAWSTLDGGVTWPTLINDFRTGRSP